MGQTSSQQVLIETSSTNSTSFNYEHLIVHSQTILNQTIERIKHLDQRLNNKKKMEDQLKSHSLTIVDPYGNSITEKYMDHELISAVLKKFKKKYIPKYLHQWIQFGYMIENAIVPMNESQEKLTVAQYENKYPIITYGEVSVWFGDWEIMHSDELVLKTRLTDNMTSIQMQLKTRAKITPVQLKKSIISEESVPNLDTWNKGTILHPEDTFMTGSLYQEHSIIMVRIAVEKVNSRFIFFLVLQNFFSFGRVIQRTIVMDFKYL